MIALLFAVVLLPAYAYAQVSTCMSRCTESHSYFAKSCSSGLYLGDDCSKGDGFCATPYSRCSDGICACLPNFMPKNVTTGKPAMCVPEPTGKQSEVTMDICRFDKTGDSPETSKIVTRIPEVVNPLWTSLTMPEAQLVCPAGCAATSTVKQIFLTKTSNTLAISEGPKERRFVAKRRSKRQSGWILPPTVVSECRIGQVCFQIGPSAYGVCRKAECPVGKPAQTDCTIGDDSSCPAGFYCHNTEGKIFNQQTRKSKQATMCCPSVCESGYYRNGRCFQDTNCLDSIDDCEDRCEFQPCRFMVNPCENYGTCFIPKTPSPSYFWCQCVPGKTGRVCEQDGISINRPTEERRISCADSLCMASQFPAAAAAATAAAAPKASAHLASAATPAPSVLLPPQPKASLACRENKLGNCEALAFRGDCDTNRGHMVANCDCACTKLILYGRAALNIQG